MKNSINMDISVTTCPRKEIIVILESSELTEDNADDKLVIE